MSASDSTPVQKQCNKCKGWFPATPEFWHKRKPSPDGLSYTCKKCAIKRTKLSYRSDVENNRGKKREYYHTHKEQRRDYDVRNLDRRRRRQQTPEYKANAAEYRKRKSAERRQYNREYQAKYSGKYTELMRNWRKKNPERAKAIIHKRLAMKQQSEGQFTAEDVKRQYDEQEGRCFYCGITLYDDYHVDHKMPISRKGSNGPENIVCACEACNLSKGAKTIAEWVAIRGW